MLSQASHLDLDLYKAYSAVEAMDWLNRTQIDIVMSDIQMPGVNGIQLVEKMKQRWPRCKVIFLTGYNNFDYAYSAIRHEVDGYILKTEGFEKITELVEKILAKIKQENTIADLLLASQEGMRDVIPLMQREFWMDMLSGEPIDRAERRAKFNELGIDMDPSRPVQLVVGRIDQLPKSQSALMRMRMCFTLQFLAGQCISGELIRMHTVCERAIIVWFVQAPSDGCTPDRYEQNAQYIKGALEAYQKLCFESLGLSISFMIDTGPADWEEIPRRYDEIRTAFYANAGSSLDIYLMPTKQKKNTALADANGQQTQPRQKWLSTLESSLENGHREEFHKNLLCLTEDLQQNRVVGTPYDMELFCAINLMFLSYVNRRHLLDKIGSSFNPNKLMAADPRLEWRQAYEYYMLLADALFDLRRHEGENRAISAINQTKQYIQEHLSEDLSLVTLAERVYFNPSYLSRLFKQTTGTNLLAFINEARLAKAKELLGGSTMKIHEIARAVGCVSPAYFTQFFKKAFQISPQEYRDLQYKQVKKH
ncbi:response regulator transcription factor [Paenibacillus spongiae]|uniref:Helix-turn-helix domain-containing protein n=1 Tax=Paenibacillus spongiae TaxID=2909671 RepID=A0ABY5SMQ3_9BACL|nr:helix-turn-helix domain-containing protein [Paenibacillus spongiae]UVI33795.1 helix-turn-helix domain-containing protein [Paenibacillus spongiae]